MAKTKKNAKNGSKMADFLFILGQNLKLMTTGLGWWENSEIFLVTAEVYAQPWLAHHKDFQNFYFSGHPTPLPPQETLCVEM